MKNNNQKNCLKISKLLVGKRFNEKRDYVIIINIKNYLIFW